MHSLTCITRYLVKDGKKGRITQERFSKMSKGLYLVATLQVKEVKALITCSCKESPTKLKENLMTSKKSLKKES